VYLFFLIKIYSLVKNNRIVIETVLDEKKYPEDIRWTAENSKNDNNYNSSKAFFLSLFDKESRDTVELDLWTKDMQVIEMDRFVFQTLNSITNMYHRATKNTELANEMQNFVKYFGEKTEILKGNK